VFSPLEALTWYCGVTGVYLPVSIFVSVPGIEMTPAHRPDAKADLRSHLLLPAPENRGSPRRACGTQSADSAWSGQFEARRTRWKSWSACM